MRGTRFGLHEIGFSLTQVLRARVTTARVGRPVAAGTASPALHPTSHPAHAPSLPRSNSVCHICIGLGEPVIVKSRRRFFHATLPMSNHSDALEHRLQG